MHDIKMNSSVGRVKLCLRDDFISIAIVHTHNKWRFKRAEASLSSIDIDESSYNSIAHQN